MLTFKSLPWGHSNDWEVSIGWNTNMTLSLLICCFSKETETSDKSGMLSHNCKSFEPIFQSSFWVKRGKSMLWDGMCPTCNSHCASQNWGHCPSHILLGLIPSAWSVEVLVGMVLWNSPDLLRYDLSISFLPITSLTVRWSVTGSHWILQKCVAYKLQYLWNLGPFMFYVNSAWNANSSVIYSLSFFFFPEGCHGFYFSLLSSYY